MPNPSRRLAANTTTFTLLLALLMAMPAVGFPVSPGQSAAVQSEFGEGAPFGSGWQSRIQTDQFFLDSDATATDSPAGPLPFVIGTPPQANLNLTPRSASLDSFPVLGGAPITQLDALAFPDPNDKTAVIALPESITTLLNPPPANPLAETATFVLPIDGLPVDDLRAYSSDISIWAACDIQSTDVDLNVGGNTAGNLVGIRARLVQEETIDGVNWTALRTLNDFFLQSASGNDAALVIQEFRGAGTIRSVAAEPEAGAGFPSNPAIGDGPLFEAGKHRLSLTLSLRGLIGPVLPGGAVCFIHYGATAFQSQVRLRTDSARVSMFTFDEDGELVRGLPSGAVTDSAHRRFTVHTLQASAWGNSAEQDTKLERINLRIANAAGGYFYYLENADLIEFPNQDIHIIELISAETSRLTDSIVQRSYAFSYPPSITKEVLRPELYSISNGWIVNGPQFSIGGRGIDFSLLAGQARQHIANVLEPVQFTFKITNTGTEDDVVSVAAADPAGGWTAAVLGGGQYFLRPGGVALVTVEVVPPPSAVVGDVRSVTVYASSSFDDVPDPLPEVVSVRLVSQLIRDVSLTADANTISVRPNIPKSFAATIHNNGTARDNFVLVPSFPAGIVGWTVVANPTFISLASGGLTQVQVIITAPVEALSGTSFLLTLRAEEVGNSAVFDSVDVLVTVLRLDGVLAKVLDGGLNHTLRAIGPECVGSPITGINDVLLGLVPVEQCLLADVVPATPLSNPIGIGRIFPDDDASDRLLFHVPVSNLGDQTDDYTVTAAWALVTGTQDGDVCDGDPDTGDSSPFEGDGVPDGWRFLYGDEVGDEIPAAVQIGAGWHPSFSGTYTLQSMDDPLTVPARSATDLYVAVGHLRETGCGDLLTGQGDPVRLLPDCIHAPPSCSPVAELRLTIKSIHDPARQITVPLRVEMDPSGSFIGLNDYAGGKHDVGISLVRDQKSTVSTRVGLPASFVVFATNRGNEIDDVVVTVDEAEPGWIHSIAQLGSVPDAGIVCDPLSGDGRTLRCPQVRPFEEVYFLVTATPTTLIPIGAQDDITVSVKSGDEPRLSRNLQMIAKATGTFAFASVRSGDATLDIQPGRTASFPFEIFNLGTNQDDYRISIIEGDSTWKPFLSSPQIVFVPGEHTHAGFLNVRAPASAVPGENMQFRLLIESIAVPANKFVIDLFAHVVSPTSLQLQGRDGNPFVLPTRGTPVDVRVRATQPGGGGAPITFSVDPTDLPTGWLVTPTSIDSSMVADATGIGVADAVFKVTAPTDALGTSQAVLRVNGLSLKTPLEQTAVDLVLGLQSTFGLSLTSLNATKEIIAPGGTVVYTLQLKNNGLALDTVDLTSTPMPTGWTRIFNPPVVGLGPLETKEIRVGISAPPTATPGAIATTVIQAVSRGDASKTAFLPLVTQVGFNKLLATGPTEVARAGPEETIVQTFKVTNNGTLPDQVRITPVLLTDGLAPRITYNVQPELVDLVPNQTVEVRLETRLAGDIPSGVAFETKVAFLSILDQAPTPAAAAVIVQGQAFDYVFLDVNRDTIKEYAIDRNRNTADGSESFKESSVPGGKPLQLPDLAGFLSDAARESFMRDVPGPNGTTVRVFVYNIDGDNDGRIDFFLDQDGDGLPDFYWDPDSIVVDTMAFRKDINGDQVVDYFLDVGGDGKIDAVFDLRSGKFIRVIQVDIDGDGQTDYLVDKNGNGVADADETVLYTKTGGLVIVQKVDVDGNGELDQVFDTDGDGNPDYFIPNGEAESVKITLRDVNRDGIKDWTYDADGDGRIDSYYDPVTGKSGFIKPTSGFVEGLKDYWYVGALFALVLALFVVLLVVTRR